MLTTLQLRKIVREEMNKRNITSIHSYTEMTDFYDYNPNRIVSFVFPLDKEAIVHEIAEACNKIAPECNFRITGLLSDSKNPDFFRSANNVYIRGNAVIPSC